MKLSYALLFSSMFVSTDAFSVSFTRQNCASLSLPSPVAISSASRPSSVLHMSDFGSAMPAKPEQSLKEKLIESATTYISTLSGQLGEGVEAPEALDKLRKARDEEADEKVLAACTYELMIEQGMLYDQDPDTGALTPTEWDIKENLETPEVKKEFAYLYNYGMNLVAKDLLDVEDCKNIVKKGLIERTGKSPEEFDAWLGY